MICDLKGGGWHKNQISHPEWSANRKTGQMRNQPLRIIAVSWLFASRWYFPVTDNFLTSLQLISPQIVGFPERLNPIKEDFAAGLSEGAMFLRERFPGRWVLIFSSSVIVVLVTWHSQTWDFLKNLHIRIFGPKTLHTKINSVNALISVILEDFLLEFNWLCKILTVSVQNHTWCV